MRDAIMRTWQAVLELCAPRACTMCGTLGAHTICPTCHEALPELGDDTCARCALPRDAWGAHEDEGAHECPGCALHPPAFSSAWAPWRYEGDVRDRITHIKYSGDVIGARELVELAAPSLRARIDSEHARDPDLVVTAAPMHPAALARRGLNLPGFALARLARGAPWSARHDVLRRRSQRERQATLGEAGRRANVRGSFSASPVCGPVVVLDDVLTTGATAHEMARTLLDAGAREVRILTLARASNT